MTPPAMLELFRLSAPPAGIRALDPSVWGEVEAQLGTSLPSDYRALVDAYGLVGVDDEVWIFQPNRPLSGADIACRAARFGEFLDARPALRRAGFASYPRPGGLLPCGYTAGASLIAWQTGGRADGWPLVLLERDGVEFERFDGGIVAFIVALLEGRRFDTVLPEDWPTRPVLSYLNELTDEANAAFGGCVRGGSASGRLR